MKARGVYVYGVWLTFNKNGDPCFCEDFTIIKSDAEKRRAEFLSLPMVKTATIKRIYIAPPKGAAK